MNLVVGIFFSLSIRKGKCQYLPDLMDSIQVLSRILAATARLHLGLEQLLKSLPAEGGADNVPPSNRSSEPLDSTLSDF